MTTSDRLLAILGLFKMDHPEWSVEEAARELGLAVSTAYRYFRSLSKVGLIVAVTTGRYVLGPAIIEFDRQIRLRDPLTTSAQPIMKRLLAQLPQHTVVLLCRLFRNQVICVHQEVAEKLEYAISYERGRAMPLFRGAASKIILANMPLRTVKALYLEHAPKFAAVSLGKNWDEVKDRLRALRAAGYSITQGELDPGMCGISVPIFDPAGAVIGSLGVVIPVRYVTAQYLAETSQQLKNAAEQIHWSLSLGTRETNVSRPAPRSGAIETTIGSRSARTQQAREPRRKTRRPARSG